MVDLNSSFVWADLDEAGRLEVWSAHLLAGGQELTFEQFCSAMDLISTTA